MYIPDNYICSLFFFIHRYQACQKHLQTHCVKVTLGVCVCVTLRSALSVAMAIVADAFANLIEYLKREEAVLKTLGATDLRACLRTGNKEETEDTERYKYYKVLNRIERNFTPEQRQQIQEWEAKLCVNQTVDTDFTRLIEILEKRTTELQELGKKSLKDCFSTHKSKQDTDFKFCQNFFRRKAASLTEAQKEELAKWKAEICGDGEALRPAVDTDFSRLIEILEKRKTDLQALGKASLRDCFSTHNSKQDTDFKFCQNFFRRKAASLTEAQKEELAKWKAEICGDGEALRPAVDTDFSRLLEILEKRKTDLQALGKASLRDCFSTHQSKQDTDFKFGQNFFQPKSSILD